MTVTTTVHQITYTGNGATTVFALPAKVLDENTIQVFLFNITTLVTTGPISSSLYTVTGVPGNITVTYPLVGDPIDSNTKIKIERILPYQQELDIVNQSGFFPDTVETQFDKTIMLTQQNSEAATMPEFPLTGRTVLINAAETGFDNGPTATEISNAEASAVAAANSASAALSASGFRIFGTVALMQVSSTLIVGDSAFTLGYASIGDGGSKVYEIVAVGGVVDGGSRIALLVHHAKALFGDTVNVRAFGAVLGNAADNQPAIQAAVSFSEANGYKCVAPHDTYFINAPIVISNPLIFSGSGSEESAGQTTFLGNHIDGPVIRIKSADVKIDDFTVSATATRRTATRVTGANYASLSKTRDDQNYGIWLEGDDVAAKEVGNFRANNVWVHNQPNENWVLVGRIYVSKLDQCGAKDATGSGFRINCGDFTDRTNVDATGVIDITTCEAHGCKGHALIVGEPDVTQLAIRVLVDNFDCFNCGSDSSLMDLQGSNPFMVFMNCDNSEFDNSAVNGNLDTVGGVYVGGRNTHLNNNRYLNTLQPVYIERFKLSTVLCGDGDALHATVGGPDLGHDVIDERPSGLIGQRLVGGDLGQRRCGHTVDAVERDRGLRRIQRHEVYRAGGRVVDRRRPGRAEGNQPGQDEEQRHTADNSPSAKPPADLPVTLAALTMVEASGISTVPPAGGLDHPCGLRPMRREWNSRAPTTCWSKRAPPSTKNGRRSGKKDSNAVRLTTAGSASTCPKSGLAARSSVKFDERPYFRSNPTSPPTAEVGA